MNPPNILLVITDQHRADCLGCYDNSRIRTPNIDRLAAEGVRCERAYVTNPLCTPARASILTGQSIGGHGVWNNGVPLAEDTVTLPRYLAAHGYRTAAIGKIHLTPQMAGHPNFPENVDFWQRDPEPDWHGPYFGFEEVQLFVGHVKLIGHYGQYIRRHYPSLIDRYDRKHALADPTGAPYSWKSGFPVEQHSCTWIGERMLDFLDEHNDRPFFAQCSFPFPHFPFSPPFPYCDQYDPDEMVLPERRPDDLAGKPEHVRRYYATGGDRPQDVPLQSITEPQMREIIAHTFGMISMIDDIMGHILGHLTTLGLEDNTIVIFCSDHGELLGDHGLLKKGPYHYEGLLRVPLIWRWPAGLQAGHVARGLVSQVDFVPTILDMLELDGWPVLEGISQLPMLRGETPRVRQRVLVESYDGAVQPTDGLRLKTLITERWKLTHYVDETVGELYDLAQDPGEFENLYNRPDYAGIQAALTMQLVDAMATRDVRFGKRLAPA